MKKLPVALITGGGRGIGAAVANALAPGHRIVVTDRSGAAEETAHALHARGHEAVALRLDVSDEQAVLKLPDRLGDWWNDLAVLVNNAGISPKTEGSRRQIIDMPAHEWRQVLDVNLTGAFLMTRACIPAMQARGHGRIVMIASQAARTYSRIAPAHYAASKAGLIGFARILAGELGPNGITVNCVAPGRIETAMSAEASPEQNASALAAIPMGRLGTPDDVATMVAYLASDAASFITGAIIDVGGGSFMP